MDVRQGRLPISQDPFSTAVERAQSLRLSAEQAAGLLAVQPVIDRLRASRPWCTAWPGFDGGGIPHYYFEGGRWLDTLTGVEWDGVK